jgi:hypothetical protein
MTDATNLPTIANGGGDVALAGEATCGTGVASAIRSLTTTLNRHSDFDDVNISLHCESTPNGERSVFSYRAYRHRDRQ